jgi:hypothetical protein
MATFNIGSQHAANINNVGGDMHVGELRAEAPWRPADVHAELTRVERELSRLGLSPGPEAEIRQALSQAAANARGDGDPHAVASRLTRVTRMLKEAGALSNAASGLVEALRRTGNALGPAGKQVLALLPALL